MHHRDRVQRPRGDNDPGQAHELTCSCYRRFKMLSKDRTCEWLATEIREACEELKYWLWAYVFMPDHVHLLVCPQETAYDTSQFLKRIKERASRQAVQFLKREALDWLSRIQACVEKRLSITSGSRDVGTIETSRTRAPCRR